MSEYKVAAMPVERLPEFWPHVWPHLQSTVIEEMELGLLDMNDAAKYILTGLTQVWMIYKDDKEIIAAFCTTVVNDGDYEGKLALMLHHLGGSEINQWNEEGAQLVRDWAKVNQCHRILFQGRKGSRRLYKKLGQIRVTAPGDKEGQYMHEVKL